MRDSDDEPMTINVRQAEAMVGPRLKDNPLENFNSSKR